MTDNHKRIYIIGVEFEPRKEFDKIVKDLVPITTPKNYKDPVLIENYIREKTAERNAEVGDIWLMRNIKQVALTTVHQPRCEIKYAPELFNATEWLEHSMVLNGDLDEWVGIGIRDLLRVSCIGSLGKLFPYHEIAALTSRIHDPYSLLMTSEMSKSFTFAQVCSLLNTIPVESNYVPHTSALTDMEIAVSLYGKLVGALAQKLEPPEQPQVIKSTSKK
jgi:hypothetical protein